MWRYGAGVGSALLLVAAGVLLFRGSAQGEKPLPSPRPAPSRIAPLPPEPIGIPSASPRTREQKRFDRYDKDRDGSITREEYLASRRKAYAKLDTDRDGQLTFDEWAIATATKFANADGDGSATLVPVEFATTAVKRKAPARCACPSQRAEGDD